MELTEAIANRRAVRAYTAQQIEETKLEAILKAGCAAPVGMGLYDRVHLSVIKNPEILKEISNAVKESMHADSDPMYGAPTLILVSAGDMPVPDIDYADAACIIENMLLEATEQGLGSVIIWGASMAANNIPGLKGKVGIPEGYHAVLGMVVGYPAEKAEPKGLTVSIATNKVA